ncbi:MAG: hypothetical protein S4CHLAM7_00950 [Chlamydiae bacterium]|nr:hypothetical protein [Chlamydiota bacterium]
MDFSIQSYFKILEDLMGAQGCPWVKDQNLSSICHYIIEEAYEVLDAERSESPQKVKEELGDLLFTVSFALSLALKKYALDFDKLVQVGCDKIVRRSPHVFKDPRQLTLDELREQWASLKAQEREEQKQDLFSSVAPSLPTLTKAVKWVELANKYGYSGDLDENDLGDQLIGTIFKASNEFKNVDQVLEDRLKLFEQKFKNWISKE